MGITQPRRFCEQCQRHLATQDMVHVAADTQREVDLLWLQPQDLPSQQGHGRVVVVARRAEQLLVPVVPAEAGIRQAQVDERHLHEPREALVLGASDGKVVRRGEVAPDERSLARQRVRDGPLRRSPRW